MKLRLNLVMACGIWMVLLLALWWLYRPSVDGDWLPERPLAGERAVNIVSAVKGLEQPPDYSQFQVIFDRPLFRPDRKRPAMVAITNSQAAPPQKMPDFPSSKLLGIISTPKENSLVFLKSDRSVLRLGVGDKLEGWTIQNLDARTVHFINGPYSYRMELVELHNQAPLQGIKGVTYQSNARVEDQDRKGEPGDELR